MQSAMYYFLRGLFFDKVTGNLLKVSINFRINFIVIICNNYLSSLLLSLMPLVIFYPVGMDSDSYQRKSHVHVRYLTRNNYYLCCVE